MKGVYLLIVLVSNNIKSKIGSLGKIKFKKGLYAYMGSAQNNLEKRVARHKSKYKKKFWHVDYLLNNKFTKVQKVFYKKAKKLEECQIAKNLSKIAIPIINFGCSDCSCKSHLFKIKNLRSISKLGVKEL